MEDMEAVWTFHCTLFLHFLLFCLIGFRPGINGVCMGFNHLPMAVEFPGAPDLPRGRH